MINPEKKVLEELQIFLDEELEGAGAGRVIYEDISDKIAELKVDISREYNLLIA